MGNFNKKNNKRRVTEMDHPPNMLQQCGEGITVISELARRINASLDLQETLDAVVNTVPELVPCSLVEIDLWDTEQQMLVLQALHSSPERAYPVGKSFPPGEGYTGWVVRNRKPLLVPDVDAFHEIKPHILPGERAFQAYVGLPLLAGDELIGALVLVQDHQGAFDENDLKLLEALAGQVAIAIQNARVYQELSQKHREVSVLHSIAEAINQSLTLDAMLENAVEQILQMTNIDAADIRILDEEQGTLEVLFSKGFSPEYQNLIKSLPLGRKTPGQLLADGQPLLIDDFLDLDIPNPQLEHIKKEGSRSRAEVPLRSREKIIGTLGVASRTPKTFGQDGIQLLTAIGNQLGVAIDNERLRQEALRAERLAAVGSVATSVAHDLRSPLGGIMRSAEFLGRAELSQETRQKLSAAVVSLVKRLINTSQQILDYVYKERLDLQIAPCSLPEFLNDVLVVLEVDFSDRGIEVIKEFNYLGKVAMDENRIAQVIYNIAANARDAMPQGGKFTIHTQEAGKKVEMIFTDTGPGVPEEIGSRIFAPFFSYGKRRGAGLGLAIARSIVEQHGGTIHLQSESRQGAAFVVSLPI
jgi:signal transduction histidine kinase